MKELHEYDEDLEMRAIKAWNKLCMVILEMLARAYGEERVSETPGELLPVDPDTILQMSIDSYEKGLGIHRPVKYTDVVVACSVEIPDGDRKIVELNGVSIGVFHHRGNWYALRNSCLHRGGPVATGRLDGDHIVCPWHGYTYNVTDGKLLMDPSASLEMYRVSIHDGEVLVHFPEAAQVPEAVISSEIGEATKPEVLSEKPLLNGNEFFLSEVKPGDIKLVHLNGRRVAVYNVNGAYYATQEECTHEGGPLSEGYLEEKIITCPWHDSCSNVTDGAVVCRPAMQPLEVFSVIVVGEIGRVELKD